MAARVIIDTDPGVDDAMAIAFARFSPQIDLLGLTTIYGNVSTSQATHNALALLELLNYDIPVAKGAEAPFEKLLKDFPDFVHGKNGFGDIAIPEPSNSAVLQSADEFLIDQVMSDPGQITVIAIGPLTNVALAIKKEPAFLKNLKQLVVMGGAVTINGNVNPAAEANMLSDPHAADFVLTREGPIILLGLDVSQQVIMSEQYLKEVHNSQYLAGQFLFDMARFYLNFHRSTGVDGLYTHDPSAIALVIDPSLFELEYGEIRVVTEGIAMGQTIMNRSGKLLGKTAWSNLPKIGVCMRVNSQGLLELYRNTFSESRLMS